MNLAAIVASGMTNDLVARGFMTALLRMTVSFVIDGASRRGH
jgi:hypothetical protein